MRKRLIFRLITLVLISLLFSASIMIVSVVACRKPPKPKDWEEWEEKGFITEPLLELSSEIWELPEEAFENPRYASYQTKVLRLKVHVVIWQVMVGAYEGAMNKLRNDIRDKIEKWIVDPWKTDLVNWVDYIIELIESLCEDRKPPTIRSVLRVPENPNYDENVTIIAQVTDEESGVEVVILSYQVNSASWINVTMNLDDGLYIAEIPPQPYITTVSYRVYAYDEADNLAISETYSYLAIDFYPPTISHVTHAPASPNYDETVTVFANVTEPPEASGVKNVTLLYKTNGDWQPKETTLEANLYTGIIPRFPYKTIIHYKIRAFDNAGNWADSDVYSYPIADVDMPLARIDEPSDGSHVAGMVGVEVCVYDENFDRAELRIKNTLVIQWTSPGPHTFDWSTSAPEYPDGVYIIQLTAYDLAGNSDEDSIAVIVDNTPPLIGVPTWKPEEPVAYEEVEVSVWVSEGDYGSGVENVTLWYRTDSEWHFLEMVMPDGLWKATIPRQSASVNVKFYIEAYDNVGNGAKTAIYDYTVKALPPNLPPVAQFSESAETVYKGEIITFDASISYDPDGVIIDSFWDFGDGTNATGIVVSHSYSEDGTYTVTLTVTDDDGATDLVTSTKTVLNRSPVAIFSESAETVHTGDTITFNATDSYDPDGSIVSYSWDFGDGNVANGVFVEHSYANDGAYDVTLIVTDDDGATDAATSTKDVGNKPPVASFTESAETIYTGEVATFNATSSHDPDGVIVSYFWEFDDGTTATGENVDHAYADDGVYIVALTVTDDDGLTATVTSIKTVLNRLPVASFTENATTMLTREVIRFDASGSEDSDGSIINYLWDFGDETTAVGVKVNHAYDDDGVYTVTLTVIDDDGATASTSAVKTVSNRPPVALFTENATKVEKGEGIRFDASESYDLDGDIVSYFWDFGDGTNSTDVAVDHAYAEDGNYTVTMTVTDDDGAS
ncbi:MAG: PKD domain-containing protein, partial [Candidatus Hermodarchaeia archaeon]